MAASMLFLMPDTSVRIFSIVLLEFSRARHGMIGCRTARMVSGSSGSASPSNGVAENPASVPARSSSRVAPYTYSRTGSLPRLTSSIVVPARFSGTLSPMALSSSGSTCCNVR